MKKFDKNTVEYFSYVIRYNVSIYIDLYSLFVDKHQKNIENYYKDLIKSPNVESFNFLNDLIKESNKINDLIKMNKNSFDRIDYWEFVDFLEEIRENLTTVSNSFKWLGSNKSKNSWRSISVSVTHNLSQNETLEKVSYDNYNIQDKWTDIALRNDLFEYNYTSDGGVILTLIKDVENSNKLLMNSVVDQLNGEKLYGLDMIKKFSFDEEENDIKVLSYQGTLKQSVLILSKLKKGDVPEFRNFGVDPLIGKNISILLYSSVVRQLQSVFKTDDSLVSFIVNDINYDNSDVTINYSVNTFYNKSIKEKITI